MTDDQTTRNKPAKKQQKASNRPAATHRNRRAKYIIDKAYIVSAGSGSHRNILLFLQRIAYSNQHFTFSYYFFFKSQPRLLTTKKL